MNKEIHTQTEISELKCAHIGTPAIVKTICVGSGGVERKYKAC